MAKLRLEDGKLYETLNGDRFRVKYDKRTNSYACEACNRAWRADGTSIDYEGVVAHYLVREVPEYRWVPVRVTEARDLKKNEIYRNHYGHIQRRVTRAEAQALAPKPVPVAKVAVALPEISLGKATLELVKQGENMFLRVNQGTLSVDIIL